MNALHQVGSLSQYFFGAPVFGHVQQGCDRASNVSNGVEQWSGIPEQVNSLSSCQAQLKLRIQQRLSRSGGFL
jgi:hypothetical protein